MTDTSFPDPGSVRTITCIGAGTIGGGWAAYFLARGFTVKVWDPDPNAGDRLARLIDAAWPALAELNMVDGADRNAWTVHTDLAEALAGTDFVQESAPENLDLKRQLLADIDALTPASVVVGSSTSGYAMTEMATEVARPERFVVGHPFNPPYLIPLVEVVGGEATAPAAVDWAAEFYDLIGKSVIRMDREVPGFIANRLQEAQWREALHMVAAGEASVEQIDRSIPDGPGLRWPFHGPRRRRRRMRGRGRRALDRRSRRRTRRRHRRPAQAHRGQADVGCFGCTRRSGASGVGRRLGDRSGQCLDGGSCHGFGDSDCSGSAARRLFDAGA